MRKKMIYIILIAAGICGIAVSIFCFESLNGLKGSIKRKLTGL